MQWDAFVVGEEWISEHYFTTDAKKQSFQSEVAAVRKRWDADAADCGETPRSRFVAIRGDLAAAFATIGDQPDAAIVRERIVRPVRTALGYPGVGQQFVTNGPLTQVKPVDLDEPAPLALIEGAPADTLEALLQKDASTLLEPFVPDDDQNHPVGSVARLLSRLFVADDGPKFALVFAGRWMMLAERERWPEGRYLAIDLQLVADRNDTTRAGETDRALACIAADSLIPDAEGTTWWRRVLDESVKHTVGVSKDLREGVRKSIEIIANDVVERRARAGLEPLPAEQAQPLAKQALRYLYRILFLLYAEASPELKVLPVGAAEYEQGYSLDRLRELVLVGIDHDADAAQQTHFYQSLAVLFRMVDQGNASRRVSDASLPEGIVFNSLKADLFLPSAVTLIDETGLSDEAVQRVLAHLLLSKEQRGADRGFISYADLGINQLGAVYEGLMSYTGFFAETDLYEVAKDGDSSKGSWVMPVERSEGIAAKDFVQVEDPLTKEKRPALHKAGSFVYRLAGRERQQSASYYTPEVLTKFVVSQALGVLLDQNGETTPAADILTMTVCEPALGSGAFAIEATRQLAEEYLKRRQKELGDAIDPDDYPRELQKVKASIALHQVYGVDLNSTAVELAEISLWLDTMVEGLEAPWFGLHLRRGNSLIGARRAVYSRDQVASKSWLKDVPRDVPVAELADNLESGRVAQGTAGAIHHFLLPAEGWGAAVDAKEAKELAPEALAALKAWRKSVFLKPSKEQLDKLVNLSYRVETLWQFALRRLTIAEREARREIDVWGNVAAAETVDGSNTSGVSRDDIEKKLADPEGAVQRIRRVMDAWNALWFWPLTQPLTEGAEPPSLDEWIDGLVAILGTHFEAKKSGKTAGGETLGLPTGWDALGDAEELDLSFAGAESVESLLVSMPWLKATQRIAAQQGFFHWELEFATVYQRGGFDLQLGNPPWVRPRSDVDALLAEGDPWWQLAVNPTQAAVAMKRAATLQLEGMCDLVVDGTAEVAVVAKFVGAQVNYPYMAGLQPDLYRCFMEQTWRHSNVTGIVGLIHPETHFTDEDAGPLRANVYVRLRRHWEFSNELRLFEIHHDRNFGVNIYAAPAHKVKFKSAIGLYHPDTVSRSLAHDGSGPEPGFKDDDGRWDLRPHAARIVDVTDDVLRTWSEVVDSVERGPRETKLVYTVNRSSAEALRALSGGRRAGSWDLDSTTGWQEKSDRAAGLFDFDVRPSQTWREVILQGPHMFVSNPFYKSPRLVGEAEVRWAAVDIESLPSGAVPDTAYARLAPEPRYDVSYPRWRDRSARDYYRLAWRYMANNKNERTLIPSLVPPGPAHIHSVNTIGRLDSTSLVTLVATLSSLMADFYVRVAPKSTISPTTLARVPLPQLGLTPQLVLRVMRLNGLTDAYSDLWGQLFSEEFARDEWAGGIPYDSRPRLGDVRPHWTPSTPLRRASDRRQALVEIDAIVALQLGVTADQLCTIYRTQFPVLYGYDRHRDHFDPNGRVVPNSIVSLWRKRGDATSQDERSAAHPESGVEYTYELPFQKLDREADMRQAYSHFEAILKERS